MSEFSDHTKYKKYRSKMLRKLQREDRTDGTPDNSKKRRLTPWAVVTIVSLSLVGLALAVFILFMLALNPSSDRGNRHRMSPAAGENPAHSILGTITSGGEMGRNGGDESGIQTTHAPPWELGFEKGREIAGVFLTNKQRLKEDRCSQAMMNLRIKSEDYLRGCLEGYDSIVKGESRSR